MIFRCDECVPEEILNVPEKEYVDIEDLRYTFRSVKSDYLDSISKIRQLQVSNLPACSNGSSNPGKNETRTSIFHSFVANVSLYLYLKD